MKCYEDYEKEYEKDIKKSFEKSGFANGWIIKKNMYISVHWQIENHWNPWDQDAEERLMQLQQQDEKLFEAVCEGVKKTMEVVAGQADCFSAYHEKNKLF